MQTTRRWLRGYFWRAQLTQLIVVVVLMLALNVATCVSVYMIAHSLGVQHERGMNAMAKNVFSDYMSSGSSFVVDVGRKEVYYVYKKDYKTYEMKRPKMEPQNTTDMGGGER